MEYKNTEVQENPIYEIVIYYEEPMFQVIHIQAPSIEEAQNLIKEQAGEHKLKNFSFVRVDLFNKDAKPN